MGHSVAICRACFRLPNDSAREVVDGGRARCGHLTGDSNGGIIGCIYLVFTQYGLPILPVAPQAFTGARSVASLALYGSKPPPALLPDAVPTPLLGRASYSLHSLYFPTVTNNAALRHPGYCEFTARNHPLYRQLYLYIHNQPLSEFIRRTALNSMQLRTSELDCYRRSLLSAAF